MAKEGQPDDIYQPLLARMQQETDSHDTKLLTLYASKGYFSAEQAAAVIHALSRPADKVSAIRMLESRLCRMSCKDSRDILTAFSIPNDRLVALNVVKRVLTDHQTVLGQEYILTTFPFEGDKKEALGILNTVKSDVYYKVGSGGHQLYGSVGSLFTQARPVNTSLYGTVPEQIKCTAGHGAVKIPPAMQTVVPSIYTGHPSYAYPPDKTYQQDRQHPGTVGYPAKVTGARHYPGGAPPLGHRGGAVAPVGFPQLNARGFRY